MTQTQSELIALLRHVVCGAALPQDFRVTDAEKLFRLAHTHDLAHLVAAALEAHGLLAPESEIAARFSHDRLLAVWRVNVQEQELRQVCRALETGGVDFLPLKGAVLRALYPEPWMRTSADLDLLVRPEALDRAETLLVETLGYTRSSEGPHDRNIVSPSGFHIELHFLLTELDDPGSAPLRAVWETAVRARPDAHAYRMPDDLMYLYHIYHAAKHTRSASCGVRTVLDTWLLLHSGTLDPALCRARLPGSGLERFAAALEAVAEAWFSGAPLDARYRDLEALLFTGGAYLGAHNLAAAQAAAGGGLGFVLRRAFPPFETLQMAYPVLKKHRWLLPACRVHRLGKALFTGAPRVARRELRTAKQTRGYSRALAELLSGLGLYD